MAVPSLITLSASENPVVLIPKVLMTILFNPEMRSVIAVRSVYSFVRLRDILLILIC